MVRVSLYCRVSTKIKDINKANELRQNPENQIRLLKEYCARRGYEYDEPYIEYASGSKVDRPRLKALMDNLNNVDGVLVVRVDRFGRSTQHLLYLLQQIKDKGKFFEATEQGLRIDGTKQDIISDLIFKIIGAVAEFEHELIRERVIDGIERARAEHRRLGRKKVRDILNIPLERIVELKKEGMSIRKMAQVLNIKRSTLSNYIIELSKKEIPVSDTSIPQETSADPAPAG